MRRKLILPSGKVAAVFIDLQEEHRRDLRYMVDDFGGVIVNVRRLQDTARQHGVPLYHCIYVVDPATARRFHPVEPDGTSTFSDKNDPHTAICKEVAPLTGEPLLIKNQASAFGGGGPIDDLTANAVEWLLVAGVWTEACIDATVKDAMLRGFRVLLAKDACGSGTTAMHQTAILNLANRLYGGGVTDTDGACRLLAGDTCEVWQVVGAVPLRFTFGNAAEMYASL